MTDSWLEFRVSEPCKHTSDIYDGCPLCRIKELEAQLTDFKDSHADEWMKRKELEEDVVFYKKRIEELEAQLEVNDA